MAAEKKLNTRILLKYDTLTNWLNSSLVLKPGELAIAVVGDSANDHMGLNGDIEKKPIVGIKVGDGTHTFTDLNWIQAIAGDVSSFVKGIADEDDFNALVNALIEQAGLADSEDIATINAKIGDVDIGSIEGGQGKSITQAISELQSTVSGGNGSLGSQIAGLKDRMDDAEEGLEDLQGRVTAVENDLNIATTGLKDRVTAVEGKLVDIDTTVIAKINKSEENTTAKINAITADYLKAADKEALQNQINTIINNPDTDNVINSINEFTDYIASHGTVAEGFRTDINGLKTKVNTGDLTVSEYVSDALKDYALDESLAQLSNTVKGLNLSDVVDGVVTAVSQSQGQITVTHKKITMDEMAQKDPTNPDKDYIFIFDCGNASRDVEQEAEAEGEGTDA